MVLWKLGSHMQMNETAPLFYTNIEINSNWIKNKNLKPEPVKFLEEYKKGKLLDMSLDNDILDLKPRTKVIKTKISVSN